MKKKTLHRLSRLMVGNVPPTRRFPKRRRNVRGKERQKVKAKLKNYFILEKVINNKLVNNKFIGGM